jgi:hypothetical protein
MILPRGVTWPSVITGVAQLPVAYTKREPRRDQVTFGSHVTTTKKKARKKAGHALNLLPVMATSGQGLFQSRDFVTSGQKALLGGYGATSGCTCAEPTSGQGTWLTSLPVSWLTSLPVALHCSPSNATLSVPIYYSYALKVITNWSVKHLTVGRCLKNLNIWDGYRVSNLHVWC